MWQMFSELGKHKENIAIFYQKAARAPERRLLTYVRLQLSRDVPPLRRACVYHSASRNEAKVLRIGQNTRKICHILQKTYRKNSKRQKGGCSHTFVCNCREMSRLYDLPVSTIRLWEMIQSPNKYRRSGFSIGTFINRWLRDSPLVGLLMCIYRCSNDLDKHLTSFLPYYITDSDTMSRKNIG